MEAAFRDCVEEQSRNGRSVLLSSHSLSDAEALCERVTIIRAGRAVKSGTLAELRHLTRTSVAADLARPPGGLDRLPGVHDLDVQDCDGHGVRGHGARVRCEVDTDKLDEVLRHLADAGVLSLASHPPTLEELFLRHYAAAAGAPASAAPAAGARGAAAGSAGGPQPPLGGDQKVRA